MDTQSSIHDVDSIRKEIRITVPATIVADRLDTSFKRVTKTARLNGFRPGKAPLAVVEKLYGSQVAWDVAVNLAGECVEKYIKDTELKFVGKPSLDVKPVERGADLSFSATVFVYPDPEVVGADAFEVTVSRRQFEERMVELSIEKIRQQHSFLIPVSERVTPLTTDTVEISAQPVLDGRAVGAPEVLTVPLGENRFPPELESTILTMEIGQTKRVAVKNPKLQKKLKASLEYDITLKGIQEKQLPEVNDEFAEKADSETKTVAELRAKIEAAAKESLDKEAKDLAQSQVLAQLVERNQFTVPQPMIDEEIELLLRKRMSVPEGQTLNIEYFRPVFEGEAIKRVRGLILVDKVARLENLTVSDEVVTKRIEAAKDMYGLTSADVEKLLLDSSRRKLIEQDLIREQVLELLASRATISYVVATQDASPGASEVEAPLAGEIASAE